MSTSNTNPFVLPGLGQDSPLSSNPLLASMEMMRQAWSGLAGAGGLAQSLPMTPPMNVEDLERRIAELRTVESWLRMNLSMLSSTIQGMEVQRSTIATLRSFVASATGDGPSPLEVVLGIKPAQGNAPAAGARSESSAASSTEVPPGVPTAASTGAEADNMAEQVSQAAQSASQAWWGLLQQQFNQIASATASTMPDAAGMQQATPRAGAAAAEPAAAAPRKRAPRKAAAKRASASRKV